MSQLVFDKVGKTYPGDAVAVANVSITLADGEFVVLVGPSGCGKSTLLRLAAGLEQLTAGTLMIGDRDVSRTGPQDRDIAMVFQNYALYPHMTVYENMAFGLQQRRTPKPEIGQRVAEVARTLDLTAYLGRKPGALSGGQRQRVAMGRAIVRKPAVFLMDEPLSNLDAKLRVQMRAELKLLNQRLGVTTLYVTHDQVEAMTMGDRVAVLKPVRSVDECNLQQIDTPQALYDKPANMFVAGFIGSPAMTFLPARLEELGEDVEAVIVGTGIRIRLPPAVLAVRPTLRGRADEALVLGIRPEAFLVAEPEDATFTADVLVTEALGADSFVFFELPCRPVVTEERLTSGPDVRQGGTRVAARVPPRSLRGGQRLPLTVDPSQLHWFDAATGAAL